MSLLSMLKKSKTVICPQCKTRFNVDSYNDTSCPSCGTRIHFNVKKRKKSIEHERIAICRTCRRAFIFMSTNNKCPYCNSYRIEEIHNDGSVFTTNISDVDMRDIEEHKTGFRSWLVSMRELLRL